MMRSSGEPTAWRSNKARLGGSADVRIITVPFETEGQVFEFRFNLELQAREHPGVNGLTDRNVRVPSVDEKQEGKVKRTTQTFYLGIDFDPRLTEPSALAATLRHEGIHMLLHMDWVMRHLTLKEEMSTHHSPFTRYREAAQKSPAWTKLRAALDVEMELKDKEDGKSKAPGQWKKDKDAIIDELVDILLQEKYIRRVTGEPAEVTLRVVMVQMLNDFAELKFKNVTEKDLRFVDQYGREIYEAIDRALASPPPAPQKTPPQKTPF